MNPGTLVIGLLLGVTTWLVLGGVAYAAWDSGIGADVVAALAQWLSPDTVVLAAESRKW